MEKKSKTGLIILIIVGFCILSLVSWVFKTRNSLVIKEESVTSAWSQVENVYQRRYDLIPNLVETVKGYASHENETFTQVTEARSKASSMNITVGDLSNPEFFEKFQAAQSELDSALYRLMAVSENYPELKANENFLSLQSQLEGTENRIATERNRYNEAVKSFNTEIRLFPNSLIASLFRFESKNYFTANSNASEAPKVEF